VRHDQRAAPRHVVKDGDDVLDRLAHRERCLERRGSQSALLKGGDAKAAADVGGPVRLPS